jgi:hypothetical protein
MTSAKESVQENCAVENIEFQKKTSYENCLQKAYKSLKEISCENYAANSKKSHTRKFHNDLKIIKSHKKSSRNIVKLRNA